MGWSHVVVAGAGFVAALALLGGPSREKGALDPIVCHCSCSPPVTSESVGFGARDWAVLLLGLVLVAGVWLNLVLVLRFDVKKLASGDQEYVLSIKGKSASKGIYGARKGLELTGQ